MKQYFNARTEQLTLEIKEILAAVEHDGLRGQHAENVLASYLKEVLPRKYKVDTGLVYGLAKAGEDKIVKSKQVDIVIHDEYENPPLQIFKGFKIFPIESVYCVISVKMTLDTNSLLAGKCNAFDNVASVKSIPKNAFTLNELRKVLAPINGISLSPSETLGVVFGFKSNTSLNTLANNISQKITNESPDLVCVLDAGNILLNPQKHEFTMDYKAVSADVVALRNQALMMFTGSLISLLNRQTLMPIDFFKYAYAEMG